MASSKPQHKKKKNIKKIITSYNSKKNNKKRNSTQNQNMAKSNKIWVNLVIQIAILNSICYSQMEIVI